jgi:hypothetical protein
MNSSTADYNQNIFLHFLRVLSDAALISYAERGLEANLQCPCGFYELYLFWRLTGDLKVSWTKLAWGPSSNVVYVASQYRRSNEIESCRDDLDTTIQKFGSRKHVCCDRSMVASWSSWTSGLLKTARFEGHVNFLVNMLANLVNAEARGP